jgi:hypothetical protein
MLYIIFILNPIKKNLSWQKKSIPYIDMLFIIILYSYIILAPILTDQVPVVITPSNTMLAPTIEVENSIPLVLAPKSGVEVSVYVEFVPSHTVITVPDLYAPVAVLDTL